MAAKKKGKWSKEAKESYSKMMKEKYGKNGNVIHEYKKKENEYNSEGNQEIREMIEDKFIAKREFDYDTGIRFEHGEIVFLRGLPNDGKLVSLGYIVPFSGSNTSTSECLQCGKEFGSTSGYNKHTASHYNHCIVCNRDIAPELWKKHQEAHSVLA